MDQVKKEIDSLNLNRGLKVYTNIDLELYKKINNIVSKYQNNDESNPNNLRLKSKMKKKNF